MPACFSSLKHLIGFLDVRSPVVPKSIFTLTLWLHWFLTLSFTRETDCCLERTKKRSGPFYNRIEYNIIFFKLSSEILEQGRKMLNKEKYG